MYCLGDHQSVAPVVACRCYCFKLADMGLEGLHRVMQNLTAIRAADVVIVVSGWDGALPSVIAGLIDAPVVSDQLQIRSDQIKSTQILPMPMLACIGTVAAPRPGCGASHRGSQRLQRPLRKRVHSVWGG